MAGSSTPSLLHEALNVAGSVLPYSLKFWEWRTHDAAETWSADRCGDLDGRVIVVTGGTGGVGLETCYELVRHGAHVFLGARSQKKFDLAKREIQRRLAASELRDETLSDDAITLGRIEFLPCDLTTMHSAQRAADTFLARKDVGRLDVFIACAGRGSGREPINEDGVESFMATNCVNHMVMLRALLPRMLTASQTMIAARIVFVSSVAHHWCSLPWPLARVPVSFGSWDDVNDARRSEGSLYAQSKLAQILCVRRLALELQRLSSDGGTKTKSSNQQVNLVRCLAVHPGEINNEFVQRHFVDSANRLGMLSIVGKIRPLLALFLLNAREGARTCLYAAASSEVDEKDMQGAYLTYPCQAVMPSRRAYDDQLGQRCWSLVNDAIDKRLGRSSWLDV